MTLTLIPKSQKMTNRAQILANITNVMSLIKNSSCKEQRFNLLDNVHILAAILQEVVHYENALLTDLDVD